MSGKKVTVADILRADTVAGVFNKALEHKDEMGIIAIIWSRPGGISFIVNTDNSGIELALLEEAKHLIAHKILGLDD